MNIQLFGLIPHSLLLFPIDAGKAVKGEEGDASFTLFNVDTRNVDREIIIPPTKCGGGGEKWAHQDVNTA